MKKLLALIVLFAYPAFAAEVILAPSDIDEIAAQVPAGADGSPGAVGPQGPAGADGSIITHSNGVCSAGAFTWVCSDGATEPAPDPISEPTPEPTPDPAPEPNPVPTASCGIPYRGIPDPCAHFGYDVYADYAVDEVITGNVRLVSGVGTPADPYFVDASGLDRAGGFEIAGEYVVVVGGYVDYPRTDGPAIRMSNCNFCVVRDIEAFGDVENFNAGHDSAFSTGNNNVVIRLKLHGFGDRRIEAPEQDYHGMKIIGDTNVWVLDSNIYDVSGDSIQCGDASRGRCDNVYIGGGFMHDNRENGVDIKDSSNVVVSGVTMYGFAPTSSSPGEAIIVHDDAVGAKLYDNILYDTRIGIVSSGDSWHEITGNTIDANRRGIELRNTQNIIVEDNSITAPVCIDLQSGVTGTVQTGCN
jgi:parallel beta-helix repeat protein